MPDTIGRITVPTVTNSGQTFPLTTRYPFGFSIERPVIVHRFGSLDAKQEQRYYVGIGPRKFQFKHARRVPVRLANFPLVRAAAERVVGAQAPDVAPSAAEASTKATGPRSGLALRCLGRLSVNQTCRARRRL